MQVFRAFQDTDHTRVGFGVRVILVSAEGENGVLARRLASLGGHVEVVDEIFTALSHVMDDPVGYGLFVMDCDGPTVGGLAGGQRVIGMMGNLVLRVPVILVSQDCLEQRFPEDRMAPTHLRAPISSISLRVGFEHALRERLAYQTA